MANVPYPLTADDVDGLKFQVWELIRQVYEEKLGGAELGDVFSVPGDVLTLELADSSGLTKAGNELAIEIDADGGLQIGSDGLMLKVVSTGGIELSTSGLSLKLDGATLELSASGLKVADPLTISTIALANEGLYLLDINATHYLIIKPGGNLTANRILTITTANAAHTLDLTPDSNWSISNVTSDKSYDADGADVAELADVLGTLIYVLQTKGVL